jgi:hypothetical protein
MWESKRGAIENGERIEKGTCVADDDVLEEVGVRHRGSLPAAKKKKKKIGSEEQRVCEGFLSGAGLV